MKIVSLVSRLLLGLIFTVFGLNGFLHFIPMEMPTGLALQFIGALAQTHYMTVVFVLELGSGVLLLLNRYVPLALTLIAPVIVNILLFHIFFAPAGLAMALLVAILWTLTALRFRSTFGGLLRQDATA